MATDLAANNVRLQEPCNPENPLENLYTSLNKCAYYATVAGNPITDVQLAQIAYGLVAETGQ